MNSASSKKEFFYIVVLILTFITVIIGATFALYYWIFSQEEGSSAVYTGTLSIEYLSGDIIDSQLLKPSTQPNLETVDNIYRNNFRVTNTGSLDILLDIVVVINENEFSDKTLMYLLYDGNEEVIGSGYIEGEDYILMANDVVLKNGITEDYVLLVWLNENGELQNSEMRKNLMGRIRIDASQKID